MKPLYPKVILYHTLPSGEKIPYFIFNRPVKLVYEERRVNGKLFLIGRDGPIYDVLVYERDPVAKAFGGRTLSLYGRRHNATCKRCMVGHLCFECKD